jgi:nicotinate-nucleotide adenylyltransferase
MARSVPECISPRFDARIAACAAAALPDRQFRLGLLGGTFDPVHIGHLILAQTAYEQFSLDGVVFMPTGLPVRKLGTLGTDAETRYAMIQRAIAGDERFDVSRIEIDRPGATYTIDTLRAMRAVYGCGAQVFLIAGADTMVDLKTWKDADEIAESVIVLGAYRVGTDTREFARGLENGSFDIRLLDMPQLPVSSQEIRERIRDGRSVRYLVVDDVRAYIEDKRLYR